MVILVVGRVETPASIIFNGHAKWLIFLQLQQKPLETQKSPKSLQKERPKSKESNLNLPSILTELYSKVRNGSNVCIVYVTLTLKVWLKKGTDEIIKLKIPFQRQLEEYVLCPTQLVQICPTRFTKIIQIVILAIFDVETVRFC